MHATRIGGCVAIVSRLRSARARRAHELGLALGGVNHGTKLSAVAFHWLQRSRESMTMSQASLHTRDVCT